MNMKRTYRLGFAMAFLSSAIAAHATLVYDFSFVLAGTDPTATPPWARLTIANDGANTVKLTLDNLLPQGFGFFDKLYLNVNPPTTVSVVGTPPTVSGLAFNKTVASEFFDLEILLDKNHAIGPGQSGFFDLTGLGLTENSFKDVADVHGQGKPKDVAAVFHIEQKKSADIYAHGAPVPEPASMAALAIGAIAMLKRRKKN